MDSTETAPGFSAEEREPNGSDGTPRPETPTGLSEAGNPTDGADAPPKADAAGETAADVGEGAPRPRRRRRRRRRPAEAATATEGGARGEHFSGEAVPGDTSFRDIDAPTEGGEAPTDSAAPK